MGSQWSRMRSSGSRVTCSTGRSSSALPEHLRHRRPAGDRDVGADGEVFTSIHGLKDQRLLCSDEVALPQG